MMLMYIVAILSWWYTRGLMEQVRRQGSRLAGVIDFFSFTLILRTLFAPYKQISAGSVQGSLPLQLQAFTDRLFSRGIGFVVRLLLLIVGTVCLAGMVLFVVVWLVGWLLLPLAPVAGGIAWVQGVRIW